MVTPSDSRSETQPSQRRTLLVLDIDETLIHAREEPLGRDADFRVAHYHVYRRPHLQSFLDSVSKSYELGVWSTASDDYVQEVVNAIFPDPKQLHFVWARSRSTERRVLRSDLDADVHRLGLPNFRKPLKKLTRLGWPIERILIVDDSPEKSALNYGNAIYPRPYEGNSADDELRFLAIYLETLKDLENVRAVEKRRWRERVVIPDDPAAVAAGSE